MGQNSVGLFECSINGSDLRWSIDSEHLSFNGSASTGSIRSFPNTSTFASLVMRTVTDPAANQGMRISVLHFEPGPGFTGTTNISCSGTGQVLGDTCIKVVLVTGKLWPLQ